MATLIYLGTLAGAVMISTAYTISTYNRIQIAKNDYEEKVAEIGAEYQRRLTMLGNTVKTAKGHKKFENETLMEITKARTLSNRNRGGGKASVDKMQGALMNIKAQVEAYPELKSIKLYERLQMQIEDTENRIYESRNELNEIARDYNTMISTFPNKIVAELLKAKPMEYFRITERAKATDYEIAI